MGQICDDQHPSSIVILSSALGFSIWAIGAYVLSGFGALWSGL
jgi:hypothetical protein